MTNEEKALELMPTMSGYYDIMDALLNMANWKDEQFEDCFYSVLSIKMLYFLNEKEKRENTTIDKMDWHKTIDEFAHYLKQQEN